MIHTVARLEKDAQGNPIKVIGIIQDITERNLMESEIRSLNTVLEQRVKDRTEALVEKNEKLKEENAQRLVAEETLRESEDRYRTLIENMPDAVILHMPSGKILYANSSAASLLHLTDPAVLTGKNVLDFVDPEYRDQVIARMDEAAEKGYRIPLLEEVLIRSDGTRVVVENQGCRVLFRGEYAIQVVVRDITERKGAQDVLRMSEEKYRTLFDSAGNAIFIHDEDAHILAVNRVACEQLGYTQTEMLSMNVQQVDSPENALQAQARIARLMEREQISFETRHRCKDGSFIPFEVSAKRILWGGQPAVMSICHDINERKRAEEIIRDSEERYRSLAETAQDFIYIIDKEDNVVYVNSYCEQMLKMSRDDIIGKPRKALFPEPVSTQQYQDLQQVFATGIPLQEVSHFPISGQDIWHDTRLVPLKNTDGITSAVLGISRDITRLKQIEETLKESENKYRTVFENTGTATVVVEKDTMIILANEEFAQLSGFSIAEIEGRMQWTKFIVKEDLERMLAQHQLRRQEKSKGLPSYEFRFVTRTGDVRNIYLTIDMIPGTTKSVASLLDITGRKHSEAALRESEEFNRGLVENLPDYVVVYGSDGEIHYVNPSSAKALGYDADKLVGTPLFLYIAEEFRDEVVSKIAERIKGGKISPYEIDLLKQDGSRRSVIVKGTPIQYKENPAVLLLLNDITERKRIEEMLRESEEKYRSLVEQVHDGIFIYQGDHFIFTNTHVSQISGYSKEELLAIPFIDLVHTDDREYIQDIAKHRLQGEPAPDWNICRFVRKDGEVREVEVAVSVIHYRGGYAVLGAARDITDRKRVETALQLANKKLTLLTSITRHDINNQLTVLLGYLSILEQKQSDVTLDEYLQKVSTAAQRISSMIQFTREYEKIGVNSPTWQDCRALLDTAAKQSPLEQVLLKNDLPANVEVFADPLIIRVCYNLIDNAVRYGKKITTIRVSVQAGSDDHVMVCEDDGVGIPVEDKEKIFEQGFGNNTGFGLALSREILSITGITIRETGEPGKGARFEITVPKGTWRMKRDGG
jgi:PAS domain S-box-containing protein